MQKVSVVIPVYNELENVPLLFEQIHNVLSGCDHDYEVILVDDGSTDGSWDKMVECSEKYPCFELIRFRRNFGQTAAMSAGLDAATGEIIITLDADLQNDPADIPAILKKADEGYDVVSGCRKVRKDTFINRRLPSIIANALISKITGVYLHDYGCTLKAYRKEIVENINLYGEMHRFIPALASWVGGNITEVEVNHRARQFGTTKYGISRTFRVVLDLLTVKFLLRYSTRPIHMFGKIGTAFGVPGLLMMFFVLAGHLSFLCFGTEFASELIKRPFWVITPFMLILFSMQCISIGLLAEMQTRTYHESQNKPIYVIREKKSGTQAS
jgi:glycosyltransferase involved in cell wall biosynthesis